MEENKKTSWHSEYRKRPGVADRLAAYHEKYRQEHADELKQKSRERYERHKAEQRGGS